MRAAFIESIGDIHFAERPEPMIRDAYDVKIKVMVTGICGSEVHAFHGRHAWRVPPVVSGHEYSGVITEIGSKVSTVQVSDRVTSEPNYGCENCEFCRKGMYNVCEFKKILGAGEWSGSFGEYVVVPEKTVVKLDDHVTFEEGALIEPLAVGIHALKKSSATKGNSVLIMGGGTIGQCIAQCARLLQADKVIVVDRNENKLDIAINCGASHVINPLKEDIVSKVMEITNGRGVDITLLTFTNEQIVSQAIDCTVNGGYISGIDLLNDKIPVALGIIQKKEIHFVGSNMYVKRDFEDVCAGIAEGKFKLNGIISKVLPIEECTTAMNIADKKIDRVIKVMMKF